MNTNDTADEPPVLTETVGGVLVITLNRPRARNAINTPVGEAIAAALERLDQDDSLGAAVLTATGEVFCAGMDLKAFVAGDDAVIPGRGFGGIAERPPEKPIIAAVEGPALAGGCELALACDMIVASETARFGMPEVMRGLVPAAGGLLRLPSRIPRAIAMEIVLTGEPIAARRAYEVGLVNHVVEAGRARETAMAMAQRIIANAPLAVRAAKRIVVESADWPIHEAFERQDHIAGPIFDSEDAREGATAFAEKRPPVWRAR
jgi:enoyl-CoA hydratase